MNNIEKVSLERAISYLKAGKFDYAIIDSDGNTHGNLEIVKQSNRKPRSALKYPMGTVRRHYLSYVENLQKDEGVEIPTGEFKLEDLQSNLCAWACQTWGKGSYSTITDKENASIMIFRIK